MELFWKSAAAVMISVILVLTLGKQERDISVLLILLVCCMAGRIALTYLEPLLDFLYTLQEYTGMDPELFRILFKLLGISLVCELATAVCADAGCGALGRSLQLLGTATMLYLSIPILRLFVTLVQDILGGL